MNDYWCEYAWLGGDIATPGVLVTVDGDHIAAVRPRVAAPPSDATKLAGLTLPGLANAHSHAFHRALRGRTHGGTGSFWTWRDQMYEVAERLDPDNYHRLARATYAEMAQAGFTAVGEFHYLHHQSDGTPYADPNAMGEALIAAAAEVGIRLTLLDTCYLHGSLTADGYADLTGVQRRFGDGTAQSWEKRTAGLAATPTARLGAAVHSVRAVDPASMKVVAACAQERDWPVHVHLSEQRAENDGSRAALGATPTEVLAGSGLMTDRLTAVHGTHLTPTDIDLLGSASVHCCVCPTTERDLADGIGPTAPLEQAGASLCLGTDSHAMIDPFEECRALELAARLASGVRGIHRVETLLEAATAAGHDSLGWPDGGRIAAGRLADLVTVGLDSVRLAGTDGESALGSTVFAATAADVCHVVAGGSVVVRDGAHVVIDVAAELDGVVRELTSR